MPGQPAMPLHPTEPAEHFGHGRRAVESRDVLKAAMRAIARQSFCTLATVSPRNRPHVVGVVYAAVNGMLYGRDRVAPT